MTSLIRVTDVETSLFITIHAYLNPVFHRSFLPSHNAETRTNWMIGIMLAIQTMVDGFLCFELIEDTDSLCYAQLALG